MIKPTTEYSSSSGPVSSDDEFNMIFLDTKAIAQYLGCSLPTARQIMYRADFPLIRSARTCAWSVPHSRNGRKTVTSER